MDFIIVLVCILLFCLVMPGFAKAVLGVFFGLYYGGIIVRFFIVTGLILMWVAVELQTPSNGHWGMFSIGLLFSLGTSMLFVDPNKREQEKREKREQEEKQRELLEKQEEQALLKELEEREKKG